ncbi:MAG: hypothetical protein WCG01_02590 [bacterium]
MLFLSYIIKACLVARDVLFDLIFPIRCQGCGDYGELLCAACLADYKSFLRVRKIELDVDEGLDAVYVVADFKHKMTQKLIKNYKYNLVRDIGDIFVLCLNEKLVDVVLFRQADLVTSVPLHPRRLRWRGFDQAAMLGSGFADFYRIKFLPILVRTRYTEPQARLGKLVRLTNISNCFSVNYEVEGTTIWLIDDVVTSGATLSACAIALKLAGAKRVYGLCLAHG